MSKRKIVAIMGEAGSGKDTIMRKLVDENPQVFHEIVSCTSRPPRGGERDGVNYHFLTQERFEQKIRERTFLEYEQFNGWYYGTSNYTIKSEGVNIGVFTPGGVRQLMNKNDIEVYPIYVRTRDKTRLLRQLNREESPNVDEIIRRYSADKSDFRNLSDIPCIEVDNETPQDLTKAVNGIMSKVVNIIS